MLPLFRAVVKFCSINRLFKKDYCLTDEVLMDVSHLTFTEQRGVWRRRFRIK